MYDPDNVHVDHEGLLCDRYVNVLYRLHDPTPEGTRTRCVQHTVQAPLQLHPRPHEAAVVYPHVQVVDAPLQVLHGNADAVCACAAVFVERGGELLAVTPPHRYVERIEHDRTARG